MKKSTPPFTPLLTLTLKAVKSSILLYSILKEIKNQTKDFDIILWLASMIHLANDIDPSRMDRLNYACDVTPLNCATYFRKKVTNLGC